MLINLNSFDISFLLSIFNLPLFPVHLCHQSSRLKRRGFLDLEVSRYKAPRCVPFLVYMLLKKVPPIIRRRYLSSTCI